MSIHRDIFKVVACLTVIGFAVVPAYEAHAQQATQQQQANCSQQNPQGCMQKSPSVDPNSNLQGGGAYNNSNLDREPGASQVTPTNPLNKPNSGN